MFTYTNEGDSTRVYREFHSGRPDHALYRASTRENPAVREFYERQSEMLSEQLRKQYLEGEAISLRGARVYPVFDEDPHVDESLSLTDVLPLHVAVDFNIAPGMHAEIGQYRPDRDLFTVVHEIHEPSLDVRGLSQKLQLLIRELGGFKFPQLHVFGDASGSARWAGTVVLSDSRCGAGDDECSLSFPRTKDEPPGSGSGQCAEYGDAGFAR
jgi:hypothetical protein